MSAPIAVDATAGSIYFISSKFICWCTCGYVGEGERNHSHRYRCPRTDCRAVRGAVDRYCWGAAAGLAGDRHRVARTGIDDATHRHGDAGRVGAGRQRAVARLCAPVERERAVLFGVQDRAFANDRSSNRIKTGSMVRITTSNEVPPPLSPSDTHWECRRTRQGVQEAHSTSASTTLPAPALNCPKHLCRLH